MPPVDLLLAVIARTMAPVLSLAIRGTVDGAMIACLGNVDGIAAAAAFKCSGRRCCLVPEMIEAHVMSFSSVT